MHARSLLAGLATTAVAVSTLTVSAGPASAAVTVDPDDTTFAPTAADVIGVGSDTTQHALKLAAEAWNAKTPAPAFRLATYAATGGGEIALPSGVIARPNGSGAGKGRLYGANNNADVDFARSSSAVNATEANAGLKAFPFALDALQMSVSQTVPSNAPAAITPQQIVGIYEGNITNWSQIDPTKSGVIAPKIPQTGSGTRSFFVDQLTAIKGAPVTLAAGVEAVQEHDDSPIRSNPNAIAPFSIGRAELAGGTLRLLTGWEAKRAVYNVVRSSDLADATKGAQLQALFGEQGFLCSDDALDLIEDAGFQQLATPANGGACGTLVSSTSNFAVNERVATTTTLTISSTAARAARLVATVAADTAPTGSVTFYDGDTVLAAGVPLVSGQATTEVTGLTPGTVSYRAVFVPEDGSPFEASEDEATGIVKTSSSIAAKFPGKAKAGKKVTGTVTVTLAGVASKATGAVKVLLGSKTLASKTLSGGRAVLSLKGLKVGTNKLKVVWAGDRAAVGSTKAFTVKVTRK